MSFATVEEKRAYQRNHYKKNADRYKERKKKCRAATRKRLREIVIAAKSGRCKDCKQPYPHWVLQFDHLGDDKDDDIACMVGDCVSEERLRREIAKCEVVCANCHADRTYKRRVAKSGIAFGSGPKDRRFKSSHAD